jgi:hypothetical protein
MLNNRRVSNSKLSDMNGLPLQWRKFMQLKWSFLWHREWFQMQIEYHNKPENLPKKDITIKLAGLWWVNFSMMVLLLWFMIMVLIHCYSHQFGVSCTIASIATLRVPDATDSLLLGSTEYFTKTNVSFPSAVSEQSLCGSTLWFWGPFRVACFTNLIRGPRSK